MTSTSSPEAAPSEAAPAKHGFWATISDQFGIRSMVSDYLIPVETNSI
jgi:hypothetical protein